MGVNYALVSQLLGHDSVEFTRKHYVNCFENEERDNTILEGRAQAGIYTHRAPTLAPSLMPG